MDYALIVFRNRIGYNIVQVRITVTHVIDVTILYCTTTKVLIVQDLIVRIISGGTFKIIGKAVQDLNLTIVLIRVIIL